ncbi:helix-hairpin-helix domain-containing protein [Niallia oryzisoli]|uniref:Helix-hairpin-helix domain-containing protein n=1 Tax=Niallia oryzisoli TaxID=1737571 RepID=A0ABZ2CNG1_9BACI
MKDWLKENKMYLLIVMLVVITVGIYFIFPSEKEQSENGLNDGWMQSKNDDLSEEKGNDSEKGETKVEQEKILIDVKGAVTSPGVYEAYSGDRVQDVINQAGGLMETADQKNVNFAMRVVDEMVLYIPMIGEDNQATTEVQSSFTTGGAASGKTLVNLNTASDTELETLPGVGPAKAAAIMEYRETNGRFRSIEELMEISGIGEKTFEKLKEYITVN